MKLFNEPTYSETEINIIKSHLSDPLVVKYLQGLAQVAAMDIATSPNLLLTSPIEYQNKHAFLMGTVAAISDLVDLATVSPEVL